MNKLEVQQRILQNGLPLALDKFDWHEGTKTFITKEKNLVINFDGINYCKFETGRGCTFKTGDYCTFKTGDYCPGKTGDYCIFKTY